MLQTDILFKNRHLTDLNPLIAGEQDCESGHKFGPAVRDYTLIHYVLKGKGVLYARGEVFPVLPGQAFMILPGEITVYEADREDPWHYQWIGFDGIVSQAFHTLPPVFSVTGDIFPDMIHRAQNTSAPEYILSGMLFLLLENVCSQPSPNSMHIDKLKSFIDANYMQPLRVEDLARQLSLDRRYLSRRFKQQTGLTLQEYIIQVRLQKGAQYLQQGYSVGDAAKMCGYDSCANFSRMFRRRYGKSPTESIK